MWNDHQPIYLQVKDQVVARILEGSLVAGEAVPSVRQCASSLALNPLTVAHAYQALTDAGVLEKRRGVGLFVTPGAADRLRTQERERFLADEWPALKVRMQRLGLAIHRLP